MLWAIEGVELEIESISDALSNPKLSAWGLVVRLFLNVGAWLQRYSARLRSLQFCRVVLIQNASDGWFSWSFLQFCPPNSFFCLSLDQHGLGGGPHGSVASCFLLLQFFGMAMFGLDIGLLGAGARHVEYWQYAYCAFAWGCVAAFDASSRQAFVSDLGSVKKNCRMRSAISLLTF